MTHDFETIETPEGVLYWTTAPDDMAGPPWEDYDGHGPVSEWTSRAKRAGERVLCSDRGQHRFYDMQEAMRLARRDGWSVGSDTACLTAGQQAAAAVEADFDMLRRWCAGLWGYVVVEVGPLCPCCRAPVRDYAVYLGAVEDSDESYLRETANEMAASFDWQAFRAGVESHP